MLALVTYEIDPATNEATGTVHFYCSKQCRAADKRPGVAGESEDYCDGTVCETCSMPLTRNP